MPNEFSVRKKWLESYPLGGGGGGGGGGGNCKLIAAGLHLRNHSNKNFEDEKCASRAHIHLGAIFCKNYHD